jgi:hypothetical protein
MTQLQPSRIQLAEHKRNVFFVQPEPATPFEMLKSSAHWAHVSAQFRPGDRIEVFPPERTYFAELIVLDAGKLFAKVAVLRHERLTDAEDDIRQLSMGAHRVTWHGEAMQWVVIRGTDVLKHSMTKDEAIAIMHKYENFKPPKKGEPEAKAA